MSQATGVWVVVPRRKTRFFYETKVQLISRSVGLRSLQIATGRDSVKRPRKSALWVGLECSKTPYGETGSGCGNGRSQPMGE